MKAKTEEAPLARVQFEDPAIVKLLFGENDGNLKLIEKGVGVQIHARGNNLAVSGDPVAVKLAERILS